MVTVGLNSLYSVLAVTKVYLIYIQLYINVTCTRDLFSAVSGEWFSYKSLSQHAHYEQQKITSLFFKKSYFKNILRVAFSPKIKKENILKLRFFLN